jgi:hypothetical protein
MDPADHALLEETVREAIATGPGPIGSDVEGVLVELGWLDMLEAEPRSAIEIVFTAIGRTSHTATALDDVVAGALGLEPSVDRAVLLPRFATWACPGRIISGEMQAIGLTTARINKATELVVVCGSDAGLQRVVVPAADADVSAVHGIDPDAGLHLVRIDDRPSDATPLEALAWDSAIAAGRRAIAHQIVGTSRTMLDQARTHAMERVQFGRPIAKFQAVRHRLADALVAIEAADATLTAAWDEPGALTAALAKAAAGRAARAVAAHCQQVLAGIGFTTDHPFHRFLKRSMALEGLFGSSDDIVVDIGHQLLGARAVPTLIEL